MVLPKAPEFEKYDIPKLENLGVDYDTYSYDLSDADFRRRHKPIVKAEKLFERSVLADQMGDSTLMPAIQGEFMRSGLAGALGAFGDTPNILAPGSAGEASVARNLGLNIMGFQDRNRTNRMASLAMAEGLFPRRTFGLSGENAVQIDMMNTAGENNYNQALYSNQVQQGQYSDQQAAGEEAADAQKKQAMIAGGAAIAGTVLIAL